MTKSPRQLLADAEQMARQGMPRRVARLGWHIEELMRDETVDVRIALLVGLVARFAIGFPPEAREHVVSTISEGALAVTQAMDLQGRPPVH
jgi:hypothetical protein